MDESEIQQRIQIAAPSFRCQLLRNNSGAFKDANGRWVRYGLGNISKIHGDRIKSSDLVGWRTIQITPEMVGQTLAVVVAVEIKKPGWIRNLKDKRENAQEAFIDWIRAAGGFGGFAQSVEDFKRILGV